MQTARKRGHASHKTVVYYMLFMSHLGFEVSHVTRQAMRVGQLHHCVLGKSSMTNETRVKRMTIARKTGCQPARKRVYLNDMKLYMK